MDTADYEQLELQADVTGEEMQWVRPNDEVELLFVDERPAGVQIPSAVDLAVTETAARPQGRHRLRRRHQAGDARDRRDDRGSPLHRRGRAGPRRHAQRRVRLARLARPIVGPPARNLTGTMRRSDQRRDAVFALYQRDVTGRPLDELLDDAKPFTRDWPRRRRSTGRDRRRDRRATPTAGRSTGSRRWSGRSCGSRCSRSHHREEIPVAVVDRRGGDADQASTAAPMLRGFVNGVLSAIARRTGDERRRRRRRERRAARGIEARAPRPSGSRRSPPSSTTTRPTPDARAVELAREAAQIAADAGVDRGRGRSRGRRARRRARA